MGTGLPVNALGSRPFSIMTRGFALFGMTSTYEKVLNKAAQGAGLVAPAYGWVGALAALLSGAIPARISRKTLLVGLMLVLALSCMAATFSSSMSTFMSARMAGALAHGAFWAMIGIVGAQLVPAQKLGLATSIIFGGVSAASVLGVPLSSFIASMAGWRNAFMLISLLALGCRLCIILDASRTGGAAATKAASLLWVI